MRFSITSEERWTGLDGAFDYDEFANVLFGLFEVDPKWTQVTLAWWNQWVVVNSGDVKLTKFIYSQVFGNWNGRTSRPTQQSGDNVLAVTDAVFYCL